ncbi:MAG TPA: HupE/UreJ family protein [Candidatus Polarisedimenticolia bacterium]|nr:HupE/UreJ family protein [Candidatus Polarisedimenticolia bacterium]
MARIFIAFLAALYLFFPSSVAAHDIPNDVVVQAFVKPQGDRLQLLIRVPLKAMRDINFPERGPGYLDLARVNDVLPGAATLWIAGFIELYENDTRLSKPRIVASRVSLPSDRSFASYEEAIAHVSGPPLSNDTSVYWDQTMLDVSFEYPIESEQSRFSIHPALARLGLRVVTVLRFVPPSGEVRAFEFTGDPGVVRLDPRWHQAALRFVDLGFFHILDGTDHLLFLLCLVIPFRRLGALIPVVTAFTIAHSITLIASAYNFAPNFLWFPPLIETLIAVSIVYMALENIAGGSSLQRRWMMAFGFGLVHGFGFSFALRESLQFAGSHLLTSLLSFNVGVELGQLLVLILLIPALQLLFRYAVAERTGAIILSALVAHTGWHWMLDRGHVLAQFRFEWPALTAALLASAARWLMVLLLLVGVLWFLQKTFQRWTERAQGFDWKAFAGKFRIGVSAIPRSALSDGSREAGRDR